MWWKDGGRGGWIRKGKKVSKTPFPRIGGVRQTGRLVRKKRIRGTIPRVFCILIALTLPGFLGAEADNRPSRDLTFTLQRALVNGCGEWISRDGVIGPQTLGAYRRCRERMAIDPIDAPGETGDVEAFVDVLWLRKHALILLHRSGYLAGSYDLSDVGRIEDALETFSAGRGLVPSLALRPEDIERLEDWYEDHPPAGSLEAALREQGLPSAGLEIYLQVFKREEEVSVWARPAGRDTAFTALKTLPVTGSTFTYPADGSPEGAGPKTVEGDSRVPEGCYRLTWQNEWSDFYLGYLLSYPNRGDRIRRNYWREGSRSGGQIVLHGSSATIGCIPVGHEGIEDLFLLLSRQWRRGQGYGRIHVFPCRFGTSENEEVLRQYGKARPELADFWESLRAVYDYFEKHRRVSEIDFDPLTGYYVLGKIGQDSPYPWQVRPDSSQSLLRRILEPTGYKRTLLSADGFNTWLRQLPLKKERPEVRLHDGGLKGNQDAHHAVVNMDVGAQNLQQCADAVMRLKAEYHYGRKEYRRIRFNFTSGDTAWFGDWIDGYRPRIDGDQVEWVLSAVPDSSYWSLRGYLNMVFTYAGTLSLSRELKPVEVKDIQGGDVFIRGGSPGHAVLVVDVAIHPETGEKAFLLAQSYMPAQEVHVLRNGVDADLSPWYRADFGQQLCTPQWTFRRDELMRFAW